MVSRAMRNGSKVVRLDARFGIFYKARISEISSGRWMRVCVTGGTGFIGGALVRGMLGEGAQVRVLARPSARADALEAGGAEVIRGDLVDAAAIEQAITGTDVVFHTAGKVSGPGTRQEFFEANVNGTQCVLEACLRRGMQRIVYISSIAVYGTVKQGQTINERTPVEEKPEGRDFYAQSKIAADKLVGSFAIENRLAAVILRPGIVYGPGRPLPVGLLGFRSGGRNFVFGSPNLRFPLNYVENLVDVMRLAAHLGDHALQEYNVVDDEDLTLSQYHAAKSQSDQTRTVFLPGWPVLLGGPLCGLPKQQIERALQDRHYSTRRIREETGWAAKLGLKEAIELTLKGSK
jgi:nucleoside-diphosphate-sugar epimerase